MAPPNPCIFSLCDSEFHPVPSGEPLIIHPSLQSLHPGNQRTQKDKQHLSESSPLGPRLCLLPRVLKRALLASRTHVTFTLDLAVWWEIRGGVSRGKEKGDKLLTHSPKRSTRRLGREEQCRAS